MNLSIKQKLVGGFAILCLLLIASIGFSISAINSLQANVQKTFDHPLTVTSSALKIEALVTAIHRSMKDVAISENSVQRNVYIQLVEENEKEILSYFDKIDERILGKEGAELARNTRAVYIHWRTIRQKVINYMNEGDFASAKEITRGEGDEYVKTIHTEVRKIVTYAFNKAVGFNQNSSATAETTRSLTITILITGVVITILISLYLSIFISRRLSQFNAATRSIAEGSFSHTISISQKDEFSILASNINIMTRKLDEIYKTLEKKVKSRTKVLKEKNQELEELKSNLELKVQQRNQALIEEVNKLDKSREAMLYLVEDLNNTSESLKQEREKLNNANKELEAFAYSVSHDLRAPLRAIDGFTGILLDDYVSNLDEEAFRIGNIIKDNAKKMGKLIDDLLDFSRLGRKELSFTEINMKKMVNSIYYESSTHEQREKVDFQIAELPNVTGDPNMMKIVWGNLISNALKYSSKEEKCTIKVDFEKNGNETTYKILDNGVGFDMKYQEKLFGVFQRLHGEKEFEGTGVGLALVQRIINRHNGSIWAESEPGKGAKFFFTLPDE